MTTNKVYFREVNVNFSNGRMLFAKVVHVHFHPTKSIEFIFDSVPGKDLKLCSPVSVSIISQLDPLTNMKLTPRC